MEPFQLPFDISISRLESDNKLQDAVNSVLQRWLAQPYELGFLLCAGTQIWYTLLMLEENSYDPNPKKDIEFFSEADLQGILNFLTRYGLQHFADNPFFNSYFGYMISLMPHFFPADNWDYLEWQEKGNSMISRAYTLNSDSPFIRALYFGLNSNERNASHRFNACKEIWSKITPTQWGCSEVQQYFFRILSGEHFYPNAYNTEE